MFIPKTVTIKINSNNIKQIKINKINRDPTLQSLENKTFGR